MGCVVEDKHLARKGLSQDGDVSVTCRLRLKKVEKDLLQAMVDEKRLALGPRVASIGQAVVALLRMAFFCLKEHGARWSPPQGQALTEEEAIQSGLRVLKGKRKAKRGR